jgi:hemoglobin
MISTEPGCAKPGAGPGGVFVAPNGEKAPVPGEARKSLFDRLGGLPAISAVVDEFLARFGKDEVIAKNAKVMAKIASIDVKKLRQHLIDQVCEASGGPCKYTGRDMKSSHVGLDITEAEWNASVVDLVAALDKYNVGAAEKAELLGLLGPMKSDIVTK